MLKRPVGTRFFGVVSWRRTDELKVGGFRKENYKKDHEKTQEPGIDEKLIFYKKQMLESCSSGNERFGYIDIVNRRWI